MPLERPPNALTFDIEDWHQLVEWKIAGALPACSSHVLRQTYDILEMLASRDLKATFFILALVARAYPGLVRDIAAAGHEIGSHGWSHRLVYRQTPAEFAIETRDAKALLENILGTPIAGYRAAEFSITDESKWALDILAESGFRYDSSIFPVRTRRYGIDGAPQGVHRVKTSSGAEIIELPLTVAHWGDRLYPVGGGGYFRLMPYSVTRSAIARVNAEGRPAVLYFHPYEFSSAWLLPQLSVGQYLRGGRYIVLHNVNRRRNRRRFQRLLGECRFVPAAEIIQRA